MKVGIIVLSWNSKKFIDVCLNGLLKHESSPVYVVDNGSVDSSPDHIKNNFPQVILICSPVNLGFASGNNLGIQKALQDGCDAIFLLNNDTIIDEKFIQSCLNVLKSNPSIGIVGPIIVEGNNPDIIQCRGGKISLWNLGFPYIGRGEKYERQDYFKPVDFVLGAAMLIRREVIEKTGGLDPEYYPAYVEEADLCYRARLLGYKTVIYYGTRIRHLGKMSSGSHDDYIRLLTSNRFLFGLKHLDSLRFLLAGQIIVWKVFLKKIVKKYFK